MRMRPGTEYIPQYNTIQYYSIYQVLGSRKANQEHQIQMAMLCHAIIGCKEECGV